jgi:hypothetical protein
MPSECFCFAFFFGTACGAIKFAVALSQLFPAAWAGSTGQCSVYLSKISMLYSSYFYHIPWTQTYGVNIIYLCYDNILIQFQAIKEDNERLLAKERAREEERKRMREEEERRREREKEELKDVCCLFPCCCCFCMCALKKKHKKKRGRR